MYERKTKHVASLPASKHAWDFFPYADGFLCINQEHEPRMISHNGKVEILKYSEQGFKVTVDFLLRVVKDET